MNEIVWQTCFGKRPYRLELVRLENCDPFLTICGSKKGSSHCGGGIAIQGLQVLYGICNLIEQVVNLDNEMGNNETKVNCFSYRNIALCGEIDFVNGQNFYRIRKYTNYFTKNGVQYFYKQHQLKPAGNGRYIQEFDFLVPSTGVEEVKDVSSTIRDAIECRLLEMVDMEEADTLDLIRNEQVLIGEELPWFNVDTNMDTIVLPKPLFEILCDKLREEPMTPNHLSSLLGLTPAAGDNQLNPASRYDPRFLERGLLLDRIQKGFDSLHYLVTQMPQEALEESSTLVYLFEEIPQGNWSEWISATFSNDEYSKGRLQSYHLAVFEIEAFEGGMECGIVPELPQLRASAIRLFDLKRHFQGNNAMLEIIDTLIERFIAVTEEINHV
jgi:hypothetical protein